MLSIFFFIICFMSDLVCLSISSRRKPKWHFIKILPVFSGQWYMTTEYDVILKINMLSNLFIREGIEVFLSNFFIILRTSITMQYYPCYLYPQSGDISFSYCIKGVNIKLGLTKFIVFWVTTRVNYKNIHIYLFSLFSAENLLLQ